MGIGASQTAQVRAVAAGIRAGDEEAQGRILGRTPSSAPPAALRHRWLNGERAYDERCENEVDLSHRYDSPCCSPR
jgi:hypothetical protein